MNDSTSHQTDSLSEGSNGSREKLDSPQFGESKECGFEFLSEKDEWRTLMLEEYVFLFASAQCTDLNHHGDGDQGDGDQGDGDQGDGDLHETTDGSKSTEKGRNLQTAEQPIRTSDPADPDLVTDILPTNDQNGLQLATTDMPSSSSPPPPLLDTELRSLVRLRTDDDHFRGRRSRPTFYEQINIVAVKFAPEFQYIVESLVETRGVAWKSEPNWDKRTDNESEQDFEELPHPWEIKVDAPRKFYHSRVRISHQNDNI